VSQTRLLYAILRSDLAAFIRKAFGTVNPDKTYLHNWHIEAIAHLLMQMLAGDRRRVIFNQPPRSLKSICISVAFVAWALGRDPSLRIVVVSYSNEFAAELHRQFRLIVESPWYRLLFPNMRVAKDTGYEFITTAGGGRLATSVGGTFTGRGADFVIIDDPQKEDEAMSEVARKRVIEWFTATLLSRLNDKARTPIAVIQQRLHEDDLSGFLTRQGGWQHLKLSAIATAQEVIEIDDGRVHAREEGEPLHATRESLETLAQLKRDKGSLLFSAHYQQEPVPIEGNLIKREWFKFFDQAPARAIGVQAVQSWDIATTVGDKNDYSVCLTFLTMGGDYYLIDVWRGRLQYPDLRRKVTALAKEHKTHSIIIEEAGPGQQLLQDLKYQTPVGMTRPIGMKPEGSKVDRMVAQTAKVEAGHVHLPKDAPWISDFLNEVLAFPNGRHDDQVDAFSQFLAWAAIRAFFTRGVAFSAPIIVRG
jgi:predicted phage terminase large subunit-like protein